MTVEIHSRLKTHLPYSAACLYLKLPSLELPTNIIFVLSTTGINNITAIWDTEEWNSHTVIRSWRPPHVEPVQGSDGTQFRPDLTSGDSITVWAPELFKSASMTANGTASLEGVSLLRFGPDPSQGEPNPTYYQTFQGLMNVTSPTAAGEPLHIHIAQSLDCMYVCMYVSMLLMVFLDAEVSID